MARNEEWYDQGFDLSDESSNGESTSGYNDAFSINTDRLKSAQAQLDSSASNIVQSDADVALNHSSKSHETKATSHSHTSQQVLTSHNKTNDSNVNKKQTFNRYQELALQGQVAQESQTSHSSQNSQHTNSKDKDPYSRITESIYSDRYLYQKREKEIKRTQVLDYQNKSATNHKEEDCAPSENESEVYDSPLAHSVVEATSSVSSHSANNYEEVEDSSLISHRAEVAQKKYKLKGMPQSKDRSNSEKSLEELAREHPDLAPEDLVKLKRSSNRCHLVSRTPVYDVNYRVCMYDLKFTAGKVFQVNALKREHVYHVLFGYFIRRGLSCFVGRAKNVIVMMPLTYDLLNYIERYSVNRVVIRICPEQAVTPSALHLLTKLRRSGMSFAIELMLLLKKDWNKAILSIEYVMIDLSTKVNEQLNVFQRLKLKAPWLKTIGYNDPNGEGLFYLARRKIDFYDGPFWSPEIKFSQDIDAFRQDQDEALTLINELFADTPDYSLFLNFLQKHEELTRDVAVFLYRFRHASPRQVQNVNDLYQYLLDSSANRSFAVLVGRDLMLNYVHMANISSQYVLQEYYIQALVRGYFAEYMSKVFEDPFVEKYAFQAGMYSMLHVFLLKEEFEVLVDENLSMIIDKIYGENALLADIIECVKALESTNLSRIFQFIQEHKVPPASVLVSYEKALMRTNELLLVLNVISTRK